MAVRAENRALTPALPEATPAVSPELVTDATEVLDDDH
jgi:hypothetical protein